MTSWRHDYFPDFSKGLYNDGLVRLDHSPANNQVYWKRNHHQQVEQADADELGSIVLLWFHCLLVEVVLRCRKLYLLKASLDFLLMDGLDASLILLDVIVDLVF